MAAAAPPIPYTAYRNFGLHVDRLCRGQAGESLRTMVETAIARWQSYGCDRALLVSACIRVFGLEMDG